MSVPFKPKDMPRVKGLEDIFLVEGKHVRLRHDGILWIPKPDRNVKAFLDQRYQPILDDRHWDSRKPLQVQAT